MSGFGIYRLLACALIIAAMPVDATVTHIDLDDASSYGFNIQYNSVRSIHTDDQALMNEVYNNTCRIKIDVVPYIEQSKFLGHTMHIGHNVLRFFASTVNPSIPAEYFIHELWVEDANIAFHYLNDETLHIFRLGNLGLCP